MFPVSKLNELSPRTRTRKIARILQGIEVDAAAGQAPDRTYLAALMALLEPSSAAPVSEAVRALRVALEASAPAAAPAILRAMNALRHALLGALGAEPAEQGFLLPLSSLERPRQARR